VHDYPPLLVYQAFPQELIPVPFGALNVADEFLTADPSVQEADARKVLNQLAPYPYAPYETPDTTFRAINLCNSLISKSYDKSDVLAFFQPLLDNGYLTHTFTTDKGTITRNYDVSIDVRTDLRLNLYNSRTYSVRVSDSSVIINSWNDTELETTDVISIQAISVLSKINH